MKKRNRLWLLLLIPLIIIPAILLYNFPPINDRIAWRVDDLKTRVIYYFNPPEEAVFVPVGETPLATPDLDLTPETPEPTLAAPSQTPSEDLNLPTSTPLPEFVQLDGVVYVFQNERWNYCAPANLAMALNFWGWTGDRDDIARVVKPGVNNPDLDFIQQSRSDKNVMPSELIDFVAQETNFHILARHGGNPELIKSLIASGFPVLVEKGTIRLDTWKELSWMGHFLFTTGYDEANGEFIVQDSYIEDGNTIADHNNKRESYQDYSEDWRPFNYIFLVVYPPDRQEELLELLGPYADPFYGYQTALEIAEEEIKTLSGVEAFYAWFNKGTSLVRMERYLEAGEAYDMAYQIYNNLSEGPEKPYRMTWYQTTPYMAYYFSGRYQDVINLANFTFDTIGEDTLEETFYWRGLAYYALGQKELARQDLYQSVWLNPNFDAGLYQISVLNFD